MPLTSIKTQNNFVTVVPGYTRTTISVAGKYSDLKSSFQKLIVGKKIESISGINSAITNALTGNESGYTVSSAQLTQKPGGLAEGLITLSNTAGIFYCSTDAMSISKPIKTWSKKDSTPPDLSKIASWEALKTIAPEEYAAYKYKSGDNYEALEGDDLTLAKMIVSGITSYSVHTPILTITAYSAYGMTGSPADLDKAFNRNDIMGCVSGMTEIGLTGDLLATVTGYADEWLFSSHKMSVNQDGTTTTMLQWIGADKLNKDLYPSLSGGEGGSNGN